MKIALVLGTAQGNVVKPRLQGIKDNLLIDVFEDLPSFIDSALKRGTIYDRILVLANKVSSMTLNDLNSYWSSTSKTTEIVMLGKSGVDTQKAEMFQQVFTSTLTTAMLVESTPVQIIAESLLRPVGDLERDYGVGNSLNLSLDEDDLVFHDPSKKVQTPTQPAQNVQPQPQVQQPVQQVQQPTQSVQQTQPQIQQKPPKKKGFFSGLFGGKKNAQPVQQVQQIAQPENNYQNEQIPLEDTSYDDSYEDTYQNEPVQNEHFEGDNYNEFTDNYTSDYVESTEASDEIYEDFSDFEENDELNAEQPSSYHDEKPQVNFNENSSVKNSYVPEPVEIDVDLGNDFTYSTPESASVQQDASQVAVDIEENLGVGAEEEKYRQQVEQPKVVKEVVTKEIIRNVALDNKHIALSGVLSGKYKKVVVVTGDRGTGVTSTALNIAQKLAQKVDVLYFDCDIDRHGLLNYIDYDNFKNYENAHMNGVKFCRNTKAFHSSVISWDENLYLLTTDFTCNCSDEELQIAHEVVVENADDFGVVVVDCPAEKLPFIKELLITSQVVVCVEASKRGFMNMLCVLESSPLQMRYKRTLAAHTTLLVTKCARNLDLKKLVSYIKAIYEPDEVNWLQQPPQPFNGKLTDSLLNDILEG